ncbi:hypothetical protein GCM10011611_46850 [Aliidongia dinghuensis]|uniref:HPt domain-containing protein n=1 Tax=Aliidongia dinghuensis TaxID=1867774 RepID=A0A8J2YXZ8_9PROT|nr:Hpt domain-containing protein [Aliidongia dinghuensis]GGF35196.1 hypothetical protein GCM10011611_46850 [Aliidongia dinghuensis]
MDEQPGIDVPSALARLGGNRPLLSRLLAEFGRTQADAVTAIRRALGEGALEEATRRAHTLKGVAGNLSAMRLARVVTDVEMGLRSGETTGMEPLLAELDYAMAEVLSGLTPAEPVPVAAPTPAPAAVDLKLLMTALDALLARNSLAARRELMGVRTALDEKGVDSSVLAGAIDRLAFAEARRVLRELAIVLSISLPPL